MKKYKLLTRPMRVSAVKFDELMYDVSTKWDARKQRVQARQRHLMRRQMI